MPLSFCLRAKKSAVFCGPMMMVRPIRKRICELGGKGVSYGVGEIRGWEGGTHITHC